MVIFFEFPNTIGNLINRKNQIDLNSNSYTFIRKILSYINFF